MKLYDGFADSRVCDYNNDSIADRVNFYELTIGFNLVNSHRDPTTNEVGAYTNFNNRRREGSGTILM